MLDFLYNDIKKTRDERKEERTNEETNERKKSHVEVAAPPKNSPLGRQQ